MQRLIPVLTLSLAVAAHASEPVEAPEPPPRLPLYVLLSVEPHSQSAKRQWQEACGGVYSQRYFSEVSYVRRYFSVRMISETDAPTQVSYPRVKFGRGGDWQAFTRFSCYPGHFVPAVHDVCRAYRETTGEAYEAYLKKHWHWHGPFPNFGSWDNPGPPKQTTDLSRWIVGEKSLGPVNAPVPP